MSEHESIRELLTLAAAGVLDTGEQLRVESHARTCEECRRELETWRVYSRELHLLPQPQVPLGLVERTRARVLQERATVHERRWDALVLAALALFAWVFTLSSWLLLRSFTGGELFIMGTNFMSFTNWSLAWTVLIWTVLMWVSTAAAALVLGRRRGEWRRV